MLFRYNPVSDPSELGFDIPSHEDLEENYKTISSAESSQGPSASFLAPPEWSPKKLRPKRRPKNNNNMV